MSARNVAVSLLRTFGYPEFEEFSLLAFIPTSQMSHTSINQPFAEVILCLCYFDNIEDLTVVLHSR